MRKIILLAHISLDGFVAGEKGELDGFNDAEENLQFVCSLTEGADAALMGRISYEMLQSFWPTARNLPNATKGQIMYSNWYNDVEMIVVSKTMAGANLTNTTIVSDNITDEISKIKEQEGKNILIFGSPSVTQQLMKADLIDSYWIFVNPVLFGKGIPLFASTEEITKFKLVSTKQFDNGEVAMNYIISI